jgi:hypothetical protein
VSNLGVVRTRNSATAREPAEKRGARIREDPGALFLE